MWGWGTIRKFGLEYCDLPTMLWNVAVQLRVVAVNVDGRAPRIPKISYLLMVTSIVMYFFNYWFSVLLAFVGCREMDDMLGSMMVLSIGMNSLIGITKLMYLIRYQGKVQIMLADYLSYNRVPLAPETAGLMAATMRNVKKRAVLFWSVTMGNAIFFNLQPFLLPGLKLYEKHVLYGLKRYLGFKNYLLTVLNVSAGTTFICFVVSNITGLLIVTTGFSEGRLLALSQELRHLWSDALRHYRENFDESYAGNVLDKKATEKLNKYLRYRLKLIAKSHAINVDLIKQVESIFRNAIAVEFILLAAGLITDLLGGLEHTYIIMPFSLVQVSMDCYAGQKLIDANLTFEDAIYDCKWENFDINTRKSVLVILRASQRTLSLSAGGVATLNYMCLMSLYKSVYSAYTALRSTME